MGTVIGRRALLGTAVVGAAAAATVRIGTAATPIGMAGAPAEEVLTRRLGGLLTRRASAVRVGRAFLEIEPGEADPRILARALAGGHPGGAAALAGLPDADLAEIVAESCRRDFERGDTVRLDGWVLSRTELRLCALSAVPGS
ncbi:hypothetical protein [Arenibaculum pallidiluteum]|uniref:hypothetical protein n=1 Tax=Arenibaculum pallidiluteum TaxID=2812559 RepID=UPI001A95D004|nr:hypothetical protein [Arenibaculum pallidiluteum]